jgi:O-antigen/teichoic acid export membrane protein
MKCRHSPSHDGCHAVWKAVPVSSDRALAHNTAWNLAGQILPLLAAVFAIPILIEGMGVERFGVFMLAWVVLGYFSLFDLGLPP